MSATMIEANEALRLALAAGEIMLDNGAETARVEDTMRRLLVSCGYDGAESFVTTTGLFCCVDDPSTGAITRFCRAGVYENDFGKVARVNDLSRKFSAGEITAGEAYSRLEQIRTVIDASPFVGVAATGVACAAFSYIFGGGVSDCANAFFVGLILAIFVTPMRKARVTNVLINALGGMLISLMSLILMNMGLGDNIDKVIIGSLMPLLPGVAMTNAFRDILGGDFLSGTNRIVDCVIVAVALAAGVGTVLKLWLNIFGGVII